jgi:hypothetical protein
MNNCTLFLQLANAELNIFEVEMNDCKFIQEKSS